MRLSLTMAAMRRGTDQSEGKPGGEVDGGVANRLLSQYLIKISSRLGRGRFGGRRDSRDVHFDVAKTKTAHL